MKRITFACEDAQGIDALMSGHFGRCPYYTMVDVEKDEIKKVHVIENPYADKHIPGKVPYFIREQNANVMIAGGWGRWQLTCSAVLGSKSIPAYQGK